MAQPISLDNAKTWRRIAAIIDQIAATEAAIKAGGGAIVVDPSDIEALNIIARIERKIQSGRRRRG